MTTRRFSLLSPLYPGGFATVYRGKYKDTLVAIKQLKSGAPQAEERMPGSDDLGSDLSKEEKEARDTDKLLSFEEFRHEVWIMR